MTLIGLFLWHFHPMGRSHRGREMMARSDCGVQTGDIATLERHMKMVEFVAYSPNGKILRERMMERSNYGVQEQVKIPLHTGHTGGPSPVLNGRILPQGHNAVKPTGENIDTLEGHTYKIKSCVFPRRRPSLQGAHMTSTLKISLPHMERVSHLCGVLPRRGGSPPYGGTS